MVVGPRSLVLALCSLSLLAHAAPALADGPPPEVLVDPQSTGPPPDRDLPLPVIRPRMNALQESVSDVLVGRLSVSFVHLFADHHAAIVAVHGQLAGLVVNDWFADAGLEVGYRFYLGRDGPRGFYMGVSAEAMESYSGGAIALESITGTFTGDKKPFMTTFGGAFEAGYQWISPRGFIIGSGAGLEIRAANRPQEEIAQLAWLFDGAGVRPRVTVVVGQAF